MCGIAGIIDLKGIYSTDILDWCKTMCHEIKHRGPDDEGYVSFDDSHYQLHYGSDTMPKVSDSKLPYCKSESQNQSNPNIVFGHRRLSILDLSVAGHQPMCSPDKKLWITYNGEIYNHLELKEALIKEGYSFYTQTDTEVVLYAYLHWGIECVNHFNGMWAFSIYDIKNNIIWGSRDRFGSKPFYYVNNNGLFAFASEHKALMQLSNFDKGINKKAAYNYLIYGLNENSDESMFSHIYELMPSFSFSLDLKTGQLKKWRYHVLEYNDQVGFYNEIREKEYVSDIKNILRQSIQMRLRSDVDIGTTLSGGIDSSGIAGIIAQNKEYLKFPIKTFSACIDHPLYDESTHINEMASHTGFQSYKVNPKSDDLVKILEKLIYCQDIPFMSSSTFIQYLLMQKVQQEGIKVTIDGQGADELFAGYDTSVVSYWLELLKSVKIKRLLHEYNLAPNRVKSTLEFNLKKLFIANVPSFLNDKFYPLRKENRFLSTNLWKHKNKHSHFNQVPICSLNQSLYELVTGNHLKLMLRTTERNGMFHSVESRFPYADDIHLIEYLMKIPASYKIRNGYTKYLLRRSLKGIIPERIRLQKEKMNFAGPESEWLKYNQEYLKKYFTPDLNEYINISMLLSEWDQVFKPTYFNSSRLWRIINFSIWKKIWKL